MKNKLEKIRKEHKKLSKYYNELRAIIVIYDNKELGVQYWNNDKIEKGYNINTDRSISRMVEYL
jgi:hypothetical protein